MLLCGSRSKFRGNELHVSLPNDNNCSLEHVHSVKYLGVEVDEHLSFSQHIDKLCRKIKSRTGMMWRMRNFIDEKLAIDLYKSMIHQGSPLGKFLISQLASGNFFLVARAIFWSPVGYWIIIFWLPKPFFGRQLATWKFRFW